MPTPKYSLGHNGISQTNLLPNTYKYSQKDSSVRVNLLSEKGRIKMCDTRSKTEIWLIGFTSDEILGSKLPTTRQVLSLLFHLVRNTTPRTKVADAAVTVVKSVSNFWQKAGIPTLTDKNIKSRIIQLYERYCKLRKSISKKTETQKENVKKFSDSLDDLFDIAVEDVETKLKNEEDLQFLQLQRNGGHGSLGSVDRKQDQKNRRVAERKEAEKRRKDAAAKHNVSLLENPVKDNSDSEVEYSDDDPEFKVSQRAKKIKILTPEVTAALDRSKTSSRNATYVLTSAAKSLNFDLQDISLSKNTVHRKRISNAEVSVKEIKKTSR